MLSRFIAKPSNLRVVTLLISSKDCFSIPKVHSPIRDPSSSFSFLRSKFFSSNRNNGDGNENDRTKSASDWWKISPENDQTVEAVFGEDAGPDAKADEEAWLRDRGEEWATAQGFKPWSLVEEEKGEDVFGIGEEVPELRGDVGDNRQAETVKSVEEHKKLEEEEKFLSAVLKGPNRAFGDLIAASGITEDMLDSLIALKDLDGVQGLPPLREIEDMRYAKNTQKSTRAEIERQKQEEVANARVRQVDEKGRAYGTGRRKCSVARVWVQPGDGKFLINDKDFDVYFPMLDHRAAILRPFTETKTLGLWDVNCTVKGGGLSGQVGAIQLGISRALQNWEPDMRSPLRAVGFLTRDSRVVERKKPGKAKARKSFQWVKR
ncbi:30S ribosomal protein S9, mitochondrial [Diospyros lotus]|uniref:30S ribosomal protein S9, mitochondrial n=1 Tax=Diospyros lotus TaxID=55363 RepID=UPI002257D874|nr:30S ribosomal protein S9, mitochondrial [Diospyros lotus]